MKVMPLALVASIALLSATLSGCGTTTAARTTTGAAAGAATGAAIGSLSANAGRGALIGAGVGALGAFAYDQHEKELERQEDMDRFRAQRDQTLYRQQQQQQRTGF